MKIKCLDGKWELFYRDTCGTEEGHIIGSVPGNTELDLSEAGILPEDLYFSTNMNECARCETYEWRYERSFELTEEELEKSLYLHFEGVDCAAEYFLNGVRIGESRNMLIPHGFCIDGAKKKDNVLSVRIQSFYESENSEEYTEFALAVEPYEMQTPMSVRKAPHMFGWDIMPRAVGGGIWRSVWIEEKSDIRFEQFMYYCEKLPYSRYAVTFLYETRIPPLYGEKPELRITLTYGDEEFVFTKKLLSRAGKLRTVLDSPHLWWPKGWGEAALYDVRAEITVSGETCAVWEGKLGIRTAELKNSEKVEEGGTFAFIINGEEIFVKGTNWVPLDAFHSRDAERYEKALSLLDGIGCNMVRMWGGNVYEDDLFYDFCDEHGIMVWQDFAMACGAYPQTQDFADAIEKEAVSVIKRLRNHACLVLWAGDNECDEGAVCINTDPAFNRVTRDILKKCVLLHDHTRAYLPSSPYYAEKTDASLLSEQHIWGPRDYYKSRFYAENKAYFISEAGYHGMPSANSLEKFLEKPMIVPGEITDELILHSTDCCGRDSRVRLVYDQVMQMFGELPKTTEELVFASQFSQASAMKFFIERMRMGRPEKTGIIWWNLMDGWPQISDAVVDYYGEKKLAYDYIRISQTPFCIMMEDPENWHCRVVCANDTLKSVSGTVTVTDGGTGDILFEKDFKAKENSSQAIGEIRVLHSEQKLFFIDWETEGKKYFNFYISGFVPFSLSRCMEMTEKIMKRIK